MTGMIAYIGFLATKFYAIDLAPLGYNPLSHSYLVEASTASNYPQN